MIATIKSITKTMVLLVTLGLPSSFKKRIPKQHLSFYCEWNHEQNTKPNTQKIGIATARHRMLDDYLGTGIEWLEKLFDKHTQLVDLGRTDPITLNTVASDVEDSGNPIF